MKLTGHPVVDTGLAIAALHAGKISVADLTEEDIRDAVGYLCDRIDPDKANLGAINCLRVLAAFWQNNPLAGKNMGDGYKNVPAYKNVLKDLANPSRKSIAGYCQVCGGFPVYMDVNRSWFPLSAGAESDPCSFPNLRGKSICRACLGAALLLPLGCRFIGGSPFFFHLTDANLICEAARDGYNAVKQQLALGSKDNAGLRANVQLTGRAALLDLISGGRWDGLQNPTLFRHCPTGATIIALSNSGAGADWRELRLPAQALEFLHELSVAKQESPGQLRRVVIDWAERCCKPQYIDKETKEKRANPLFDRLCDDIEERRSIAAFVRHIVKGRKSEDRKLRKEEKKVLELYEQIALGKDDRFAHLVRIADKIKGIDERYRVPLLKRLASTRTRDSLFTILKEYANADKADLKLSHDELRVIYSENSSEVSSLLYLLCLVED